jgi:hypothetical protein
VACRFSVVTSPALEPGASGSPILDVEGDLIGVVCSSAQGRLSVGTHALLPNALPLWLLDRSRSPSSQACLERGLGDVVRPARQTFAAPALSKNQNHHG